MSHDDIWILGVSMTRFGRFGDLDLVSLGSEAAVAALRDADIGMADVDFIACGNLQGPGRVGQRIQKQIGQTGVPVFNVANACATGATAVRAGYLAIKAGEADMALAVGVEKLSGAGLLAGNTAVETPERWEPSGSLGAVGPTDGHLGTDTMAGLFAMVGQAYRANGASPDFELFARISEKNHAHSTLNPLAAYQKRLSLQQIMGDPMISYPNTRAMCSANCDGAAAAVLVSGERLRSMSTEQRRRAVKVSASVLVTDPWEQGSHVLEDVNTATRNAARRAYEIAGVDPADLDLVELHDCFATAELVHYDNLMLCEPGGAVDFFESGAPWRDGHLPVNVSGGLQSKGHPVSATGIANLYEVATHLRGEAGDRQITDARVGLTHVLGLGVICAVHVLERAAV